MQSFIEKLNKYFNLRKPMPMVNIQMVFIGATPEEDQTSIIKTGFKKIYRNGVLKTNRKTIEVNTDGPVKEVLQTHKFTKHYDYTLLDQADTFVAQFIPEPLNEEVKSQTIDLKLVEHPIFNLKDTHNTIYNKQSLHFNRIHSAIMDGIYVYVNQDTVYTFVNEDLNKYIIPDHIIKEARHFEFAIMSAAQIKQQKAIFVDTNKRHSAENLRKYQPSIAFDLTQDYGANVFLDEISLFSWSSNIRGTNVVPNKILAYMSLCLSNSSTVKTPLRIKHIGEIKIKVTPELVNLLSQHYNESFMRKIVQRDAIALKDLYKTEKWDGMGVIRASKAREIHIKTHPADKNKDLMYFVGMACIQRLIPGTKGLLYVVHDDEFDNAVDPDGNFVYRDFDVILEDSNVKYICHESYVDLDQFEIVRWSKVNKFSHNMSYGYWLALDINDEERIKSVVQNMFQNIYRAIYDPSACKAYLNMIESQQIDEEVNIEDENLNTIFNKILNIVPDAIYDPLLRNSLKFIFKNEIEKAKFGSLSVQGACRFIVTDPIGFFLTENMVPRLNKEGSQILGLNNQPLYDIVIEDINSLVLKNPNEIFWRDDCKDVLLFRAPCYHAGQVPKARMINQLPDVIPIGNRTIRVSNLYDTTYWKGTTIVINALGMMLEAMGGADCDGDQATIIEDPDIVALRSETRDFDIPEDAMAKPLQVVANVNNFKQFLKNNLKINKVGIFSNQMTVLGDLSSHILSVKKEVGLPIGMLKVLETISYKVHIALNETSEYGYTFNSYSASEQKHLMRMKDFSNIFQTLTVNYNGENKNLKDVINIYLYKSLYNTVNILDMLSEEDFNKFQMAVYNYAEAGRDTLSSLQMQEIDSAKTGVSIDLHKFPYLSNTQDFNFKGQKMKLSYAPTWFLNLRKKSLKNPGAYTSLSIPGKIYTMVCEEEAKLNKAIDNFLDRDGNKLSEKRLIANNYDKTFPNANKCLKNIINSYSQERMELNKKKQKDVQNLYAAKMFSSEVAEAILEQYKIKCNEITEKYNNLINIYMKNSALPIDKLVTLCYNISVDAAENHYSRSFFVNVLKYEFIVYLLLHQQHENLKLAKVKLVPSHNYTIFKNQTVVVKDEMVFLNQQNTELIGSCKIDDGVYTLNTIKDLTYICYENENTEIISKEVQNRIIIINDNAAKLLNDNHKILCKTTNREDGKIFTSFFINEIEIGSLVNYGLDITLHNKEFYYRILSHTSKRYVLELRSDQVIENVIEFAKPTCFLTGKLETYTQERLQKLCQYTILCSPEIVNHNLLQLIKEVGNEFTVCKNQDQMILEADYFVGQNEQLLQTIAMKTNKKFLLV